MKKWLLLALLPFGALAQNLELQVNWTPVDDVSGYLVTYTQNGVTRQQIYTAQSASMALIPLTTAGTVEVFWSCFCEVNSERWPCEFYDVKTIDIVDISPTQMDTIQLLQTNFGVAPIDCGQDCIVDP